MMMMKKEEEEANYINLYKTDKIKKRRKFSKKKKLMNALIHSFKK